jgi:hypothetical protein
VFQATTEPKIERKTSRRQVECWRFFWGGVLKCFSCLSEGRAKERKKERKKEGKKGVRIFFRNFYKLLYVCVYVSVMVSRGLW